MMLGFVKHDLAQERVTIGLYQEGGQLARKGGSHQAEDTDACILACTFWRPSVWRFLGSSPANPIPASYIYYKQSRLY